jgi:hypothetical protein
MNEINMAFEGTPTHNSAIHGADTVGRFLIISLTRRVKRRHAVGAPWRTPTEAVMVADLLFSPLLTHIIERGAFE